VKSLDHHYPNIVFGQHQDLQDQPIILGPPVQGMHQHVKKACGGVLQKCRGMGLLLRGSE
jgi:hypothetical protein